MAGSRGGKQVAKGQPRALTAPLYLWGRSVRGQQWHLESPAQQERRRP